MASVYCDNCQMWVSGECSNCTKLKAEVERLTDLLSSGESLREKYKLDYTNLTGDLKSANLQNDIYHKAFEDAQTFYADWNKGKYPERTPKGIAWEMIEIVQAALRKSTESRLCPSTKPGAPDVQCRLSEGHSDGWCQALTDQGIILTKWTNPFRKEESLSIPPRTGPEDGFA